MSVKKKVDLMKRFANSVNGFMRDGRLVPAYRITNVVNSNFPAQITYAAYSKAAGAYFIYYNKTIGVSSNGSRYDYYSGYIDSNAFLIEDYYGGETRAIIITVGTAAVYEGNNFRNLNFGETMTCGVMHRGRLIGAHETLLKWSGPEGFYDWKEGINGCGYMDLGPAQGNVLNILEYGGKVVAVREYGLTVLNWEGNPEDFSIKLTDTACDKVYKNTACVVGGKLYFFTQSGLKCFDGTKITPLKTRHSVSAPWSATVLGSRYFLACISDYLERDAILCVDTADGESCIIDDHADTFLVKDKVFYFLPNAIHRLDNGGSCIYEAGPVNFGTDKLKTLSKIDFDNTLKVGVSNEKHTRDFGYKLYTCRPRMRGVAFWFRFESTHSVSSVTATAEVPYVN